MRTNRVRYWGEAIVVVSSLVLALMLYSGMDEPWEKKIGFSAIWIASLAFWILLGLRIYDWKNRK